jgi:hypothetical protein
VSKLVREIWPIRDQSAGGKVSGVDRGQFVPGGQRDDQIMVKCRRRARSQDQATIGGLRERRDGALDLGHVPHVNGS